MHANPIHFRHPPPTPFAPTCVCILTGMVQAQAAAGDTAFEDTPSGAPDTTPTTPTSPSTSPNPVSSADWETVNRVIYPMRDADQTMPLYAVNWHPAHFDPSVFDERDNLVSANPNGMTRSELSRLIAASRRAAVEEPHGFAVDSRNTVTLAAGTHLSLCTYFNAFPAGYWRYWTRVRSVRFAAWATGKGTVTLFRSTARGLATPVETFTIDTKHGDGGPERLTAELSLKGMLDGGFYWFDARADADASLTVGDAVWQVPARVRRTREPGTVSVAITTFNRPSYCLDQLRAIAGERELRDRLDTVYCTDQGTDLVRDQSGFAETADDLGGQLTYIRQGNLGGSGGFSRGMYETVKAGTSDYTLLLDDDAISEPESILRAVQFADYTVRPVLVGGGMFHIDHRTVLHVQGERYDAHAQWMEPSRGAEFNHDFRSEPLADSPSMHAVRFSDFNGWWFCLIPVETMRVVGLGLPVFIKFDDIEYGLRAKRHGFPTVSLPGVAVWHMGWHDKDPARGWEEYFQVRNRWVCALLHYPNAGRAAAFRMLYEEANLGLRMLYSGMELGQLALADLLKGPEYLVESLPTKIAEVREARQGFTDSVTYSSPLDLPEPDDHADRAWAPAGAREVTKRGMKAVLAALRARPRADGAKDEAPQVAIPARFSIWPSFLGIRSAMVTSADGDSVAWFRRDSRLYRRNMRQCLGLVRHLARNWKRLSKTYRDYDLPSMRTWEQIFHTAEQ